MVDENVVATVSHLLNCDHDFLMGSLVRRTISTGAGRRQSTIQVPLDQEQAIFTRDSLAKGTVGRSVDQRGCLGASLVGVGVGDVWGLDDAVVTCFLFLLPVAPLS